MSGKDNKDYGELDLDSISENDGEISLNPEEKDEGPTIIFEGEDDGTQEKEQTKEDGDSEEEGQGQKAKKKPRKSRAQERIRKLANERKALEDRLHRAEQENFVLGERMREQTRTNASTQKQVYKDRLEDLKESQAQLMEQGEYKKAAGVSEEIAKANLRMEVMDYQEANVPPARRAPQRRAPQIQEEVPEAAQDWAKDNDWFFMPKDQDEAIRKQGAIHLGTVLMREGLDPQSEEYYETLNERLDARFGALGTQSTHEDQEGEDETAPRKRTKPVVGGTGRQGVTRRRGKTTYRLTAQDKEIIDDLGITPQEYVAQLRNQEDTGWTEIT